MMTHLEMFQEKICVMFQENICVMLENNQGPVIVYFDELEIWGIIGQHTQRFTLTTLCGAPYRKYDTEKPQFKLCKEIEDWLSSFRIKVMGFVHPDPLPNKIQIIKD